MSSPRRNNVRIHRPSNPQSATEGRRSPIQNPKPNFLHSLGLYFDSTAELRQYLIANNIAITPQLEKVLTDLEQREIVSAGPLRAHIDNAIAKLRARIHSDA